MGAATSRPASDVGRAAPYSGRSNAGATMTDSMRKPTTGRTVDSTEDQARGGLFRIELAVQLLAAGFFGLVPLLVPDVFAQAFGLTGDDPYMIRLAGAATLGYAATAIVGL